MLYLFFFILLIFSVFTKHIMLRWIFMEILTFFSIFLCINNNIDYKNLISLFKYIIIQAWVRLLLIFFFFFFFYPELWFTLLCVKLRRFPRYKWVPELLPKIKILYFFIILTFPKVYPIILFNLIYLSNFNILKFFSVMCLFVGNFRALYSINFKAFFSYASISQIRWFFFCIYYSTLLNFIFFFLYIIIIYYFFYIFKNINYSYYNIINWENSLVFLSYGRLPIRIPFFMKYIVIIVFTQYFIYFFFFLFLYYLYFFTFIRFTWYNMYYNNFIFIKYSRTFIFLYIIIFPLYLFYYI